MKRWRRRKKGHHTDRQEKTRRRQSLSHSNTFVSSVAASLHWCGGAERDRPPTMHASATSPPPIAPEAADTSTSSLLLTNVIFTGPRPQETPLPEAEISAPRWWRPRRTLHLAASTTISRMLLESPHPGPTPDWKIMRKTSGFKATHDESSGEK